MFTIMTTRPVNGTQPLLTKTFTRSSGGGWIKADYDQRAFLYDVTPTSDFTGIDGMAELLAMLEGERHSCIVRGEPIGETENIRRALRDDPARGPATLRPVAGGLPWLMLDFDKIPVASHGLTTNEQRLAFLLSSAPSCFHDVSYYYQWSASAGTSDDGWNLLSCHFWFWLSTPWRCRDLYERFDAGDFSNSDVDPAPFTPNQPHYTAAPIFINADDPLEDKRSGLVHRLHDTATLPAWIKPIPPRPVMPARQHHQRFPFSRLDDLLADIGPNYHAPIRKAIAHYCYITDQATFDKQYLLDRLTMAISNAVAGKNRKQDYLSFNYLNRLIDGALRKFGSAI